MGARVGDAISTQANRTADAPLRAVSDKPTSGTSYEQWTKAQLVHGLARSMWTAAVR